jgi:ketosteroid isomerase-like protein
MATVYADERALIEELFSRYLWSIDTGDVEILVDCFTPEGSLESPAVGKYAGHEAIREFAMRFARFREQGSQLRHVVSTFRIEISGETAFARCYLLAYITRNGKSSLLGPGTYACNLQKNDGRWRFTRRIVTMDHEYELEGI